MRASIKKIATVSLLAIAFCDALTAPKSTIGEAQRNEQYKKSVGSGIKELTSFLHTKPETALLGAETRGGAAVDDIASFVPSITFLLSAAALALLAFEIRGSSLPKTIGTWSLFWTTIAVGWDNLIIGLGKPFFSDAETNKKKYDLLKALSIPRFTAHAVFVPFLYVTCGEIGKALNIGWLQGDLVQKILVVAAAALGIISRVRFVNSPGIELSDTSDSPPNAWERDLVWFTYVKAEFLYVVPAIVLALFEIVIGIAALLEGSHRAAAALMVFAGVAVLYGNAKPSYIMRFTGNIVEVVMLWAVFLAAFIVL